MMLYDSFLGLSILIIIGLIGEKFTRKVNVHLWIFMLFLFFNSLYQFIASIAYSILFFIPSDDSTPFSAFMGDYQVLLFIFYAFVQLGGEVVRFMAIKKSLGKVSYYTLLVIAGIAWVPAYILNSLNLEIYLYFNTPEFYQVDVLIFLTLIIVWSIFMTYFSIEATTTTKFVLFAAICFYFLELMLVAIAGMEEFRYAWPNYTYYLTLVLILLISIHQLSKQSKKSKSSVSTQS